MHKDVLKIAVTTFYKHFTPQDISDIENEAFEIRKKNSARERSELMVALHKEGKSGNVQAVKEYLDRTEGKVVAKTELSADVGIKINVVNYAGNNPPL